MASWFTRAIDRITPWDRGGEVQRRQERKRREDEERQRSQPQPTQSTGLSVGVAQPTQKISVRQPENRFKKSEYDIGIKVTQAQDNRKINLPKPARPLTPEEKRINAVERGFDAGKSWEDIARENQLDLDSVREYSKATRPDYGIRVEKPKQSFWNKVRDQFDANTQADQYRRAKGNMEKGENKDIVLRNPGNIISHTPIIGHVAKTLNTLPNQARELVETGRGIVAGQTNNAEAFRASQERQERLRQNYQKNKGGLFNVGTLYDSDAAARGDFKTGLTDIVAPTAVSMLDLYTLGKGAALETAIKEDGIKALGTRAILPTLGKAAAGNYASGDISARAEGADNAGAIKSGLINSVLGLVPDIGLPAITKSFKTRVLPKIFRGQRVAVKDVVNELDDAAISASAEAANRALTPKRIPIKTIEDIPVDVIESLPQQINVRNLNEPGRLIQEVTGDASIATPNPLIKQTAEDARATAAREAAFDQAKTDPKPNPAIEGITPRQPERPYSLNTKQVAGVQDELIDDYASFLKSIDDNAKGGMLVPDGEKYGSGYKRTTEHSKFYSNFYKENKRKPSKTVWRDEAERQLRSSEAESSIQKMFDDTTDPEVQSLLARGERPDTPQGKPIRVKEVRDIPVVDKTEVPTGLPEQPGTVRATTQADNQAVKTQMAAEQPPVVPRNSKGERLTPEGNRTTDSVFEVDESGQVIPKVNSDSTSPIESLEMPTSGDVAPNTTYNRIIADETVPKEVKNSIYNMTHEVHSDQKLIKSANELVNSDTKLAQELFDGRHFANQGKVDSHVHLGNSLIEQYNKIGDTDMAGAVYDELIRSATQTGQGLRAFQSISKISPQGIVRYAERIADEAGKPLSDELRGKLVETAKNIAKMEPGEMKSDAIQNMIQMARQPDSWSKAGDIFKSIVSTPRAIMASSDLSFGGRQGAVLGARYPKEWAEAQARSAKYAVSEKSFKNGMKELANLTDSNGESLYSTFKAMDLDMPAVFGKSEEVFGETNLIESKAAKKAGVGHVVAGSDRAFSGAAAELRANVAKKIIDGYGGVKGIQNWTKKDLTDLGKVINTATGRGSGKKGGWFEKAAPALGDTLFSARLWKSRLDLLNPVYYARLSPAARKVALQSSGAFSAVVSATLAAAAMAGADIETDPRSSDFGKIKVGNNRYDVMGGLQQNIVLAARQITGEKKNSTTGEITRLDTAGYGKPTRLSVLGDTLQNKLSPVLGAGTTLLEGKDRGGQPIQNPWGEIAKLFIPLGVTGTYETIKDESERAGGVSASTIAKGIAKSAPGFLGVGVQTYGPTNPKEITSNDVLKQLNKEGISTKQEDIDGYISNGEYDKARRASEYNLQKLEADEESSENDKQNARNKIRDLGYQERGIPSSSDGILKAFENDDWDKMIEGNRWALDRAADDGEISQKTKDKYEREIRKAETLRDSNLSSTDWEEYDSIDVNEWRKLADTDPEAYNRLWQIDQLMAQNNVSDARGKSDKQKYSIKESKSGSGRGGSRRYSTEFGKITGSGSNPINVRSYASMLEQARSGSTTPLIKRTRPNIVHRIGTRGYN